MRAALEFVACDLGAESGRCMLGQFDGERVALSELSRFPNGPIQIGGSLHWDVLRLFGEIVGGLRRCARDGHRPAGIGLDTWGVDFALLDRAGNLLGNPYHYRDRRTQGMPDEAFRRVPREDIFAATGIQVMPINTLYQLLSQVIHRDPQLEQAQALLMMPDLLNFWLCGRTACEFTDATTSQCVDPRTRDWATSLLQRLQIPTHILQPIVPPATILGLLRSEVAADAGLDAIPVIAPACHDTAAAVAAVPAAGQDFAYISSGTWSLVGIESAHPHLTPAVLRYNFTNEGGIAGTFRLLKNVAGLWLVQECRRRWERDGPVEYAELMRTAAEAPAFGPIIDPDHEQLLRPPDMPAAIRAACRESGQPEPAGRAAMVRCILDSLALKYRWVIDRLEEVSGRQIRAIHILGGGSRNDLLCRLTADATGRPVYAGPAEATAMGNTLVQAMALGHLASLADLRAVARRSAQPTVYEPRPDPRWDAAMARLE